MEKYQTKKGNIFGIARIGMIRSDINTPDHFMKRGITYNLRSNQCFDEYTIPFSDGFYQLDELHNFQNIFGLKTVFFVMVSEIILRRLKQL